MDIKKAVFAIYFLIGSVVLFFQAGGEYATSNSSELIYMLDWRILLILGSMTLCASAILSYVAVVEYWDAILKLKKSEEEE